MAGELIFPLREGRWRVAEGQGRIFSHHWAALEQREAIDLVRISRNQRSRRGIFGQANKNFHSFGTIIVAPGEGTIVHVRDGLPDSGDSSESAGNHVIIDNGYEHILLTHMRSGTISVEPHLHLEVERNGQPLRVRFMDVHGRLGKGRVISAS